MLKKLFFASVFVLLTTYNLQLTTCSAQPISSAELINKAKSYDGRIVSYEGEIIGDIMKRGDSAWININDGDNAIGVWLKTPLLKDVVYTGSYKSFGDKIEVTGIFHRSCPEHGGDLDIHAQLLRKINPGRMRTERLNPDKRNHVIILLGLLISVWILSRLKRK